MDLFEVTRELAGRKVSPPVVIRFPEILRHRMSALRNSFDKAISELGYGGSYSCVYPLKVNQERHVCEVIRDFGDKLGFGLEVGSKPELLAGLFLTRGMKGMPLVCNGFKDVEYIEIVTLAAKMGRNVFPVVEQAYELKMMGNSALRHGLVPRFGIRAKLAAAGIGRWAGSSGLRGKFGLTTGEVLHAVDYLTKNDLLSGFKMLHCHMGSQVFDIRAVRVMASELAQLYVQLWKAGVPIEVLNIGGGLGIDYDGTQSATACSVNYTLEQYACDVVHRIGSICDQEGVPHPDLMSESGRWLAAHSSLLVCEVVGSRTFPSAPNPQLLERALQKDCPPQPLLDAHNAYERVREGDLVQAYADAEHALVEAAAFFRLGQMDLEAKAACEELFWATGRVVLSAHEELQDGLDGLPDRLADIYFLNLSVFQSLLDSWGIEQLFPVVPIHRLNEQPTRRGVLVDITCDSDGRVDRFVAEGGSKATLELHPTAPTSEPGTCSNIPYYLGFFLTGAYQETLGDLHNLLGDSHAVHVSIGDDGDWRIDTIVEGDTVSEVLGRVQFDADDIRIQLHEDVRAALVAGRITRQEGASLRQFLDDSLEGYTYLK